MIIIKLRYFFCVLGAYMQYLNGLHRIKLGFCPVCNSDAPELYDCGMCEGYHSTRGESFPPTKELKDKWKHEYKSILRFRVAAFKAVKEWRIRREYR